MSLAGGLVGFGLGVVASIIAGLLLPPIRFGMRSACARAYCSIFPGTINITDKWAAEWTEVDANGSKMQSTETVRLSQGGHTVKGESTVHGIYQRRFCYNGEIYNEIFTGSFWNKEAEAGAVSGRGAFLLKISSDRRSMSGACIWVDWHTNKVEWSDYKWSRV